MIISFGSVMELNQAERGFIGSEIENTFPIFGKEGISYITITLLITSYVQPPLWFSKHRKNHSSRKLV